MIMCVLLFHRRLNGHLRAHGAVPSHDARAAVQAVELGTRCKSQERGWPLHLIQEQINKAIAQGSKR